MAAMHSNMTLPRARLVFLVLVLAGPLATAPLGCSKRPSNVPALTTLPFQLVERNGATALEFTNWTIVFEAIPARAVNLGSTGVLTFAGAASRSGEMNAPGIQIRQFAGKDADIISVNNYTFKLMTGARQISFNDHAYEIKQAPRTILIAADGKTREQPAP